jgi:anti-sigma B factor antagonist
MGFAIYTGLQRRFPKLGTSGLFPQPVKIRQHPLDNQGGPIVSFSLNTRKVGGVIVVDMSGRLASGEAVLLLRNTVRRFVEDGSLKFVLNLGEVSHIDSSGLGELITCYTTIRNKGGDVKLARLTARVKDLLQLTKLLTVFDTYDDEQKAVAALG